MPNSRIRVAIHCQHCGEQYILRGKEDKGKISTGFKRCLCNNESEFDVKVLDQNI